MMCYSFMRAQRYEAGSKPLKPHEAEPVVQVDMQSAQTREQIELTKACMGHVSFVGLSFKMNGRKHVTQWLRAFTQLPRFGGADAGLLQAFEVRSPSLSLHFPPLSSCSSPAPRR